jgi:TPR repeat protein
MGDARLEFAQAGCGLGHTESCWAAGTQAAYARRGSDDAVASASFEQGCELGHALSCLAVGDRHQAAGDLEGAIRGYEKGCTDVGDVACDLAQATRVLVEQVGACETGDTSACREACPRVADDTVCALALPDAVRACDGREREACTLLGHIYGAGRGVDADLDRANALLWLACDLDDAVACLRLEDNLSQGRGVAPAGSRSVSWLRVQVCDLQMDYGCAPHGFWP